jgi:hypothetical protein
MKSTLASSIAPATINPLSFAKTTNGYYTHRKIRKIPVARRPAPPSEETLSRLNVIGREYPFCVNYKGKPHDPL